MMSRKNLLTSLTERKLTAVNTPKPAEQSQPALSPAMERNRARGAFGAITRSIDELAERAQAAKEYEAKLLEGASVVELDPEQIDGSFIADRIGDDEEAFNELVAAIEQRGQDSPVLLRPHPQHAGRYMVVFGHRRVRAARALKRPVRAVIKPFDDTQHVIAQGQENSVRADLSFIEKALFAFNLEQRGYSRDVIMAALSVDKTVVSKMISVVKDIPPEVISAIGAAKETGRDRWYQLAVKLREPEALEYSSELIQSSAFKSATSDQRILFLAQKLTKAQSSKKRAKAEPVSWAPADNAVSVTLKTSSRQAVLSLREKDGAAFARFINDRLEDLYEDFRQSQAETGEN